MSATFCPGTTAVVGPNGSGKTTLIRIIATAETPDSGEYSIDGSSALSATGRRELRSRLGWLPQNFSYEPRASVASFLKYIAWMRGLNRDGLELEPGRVLGLVQLSDRSSHQMRSLSGGMLRRVGIASALIGDPEILILDEPTAGLDPDQRENLYSILRAVSRQKTVILSTHVAEDIRELADEKLELDGGKVLHSAPAVTDEEIAESP